MPKLKNQRNQGLIGQILLLVILAIMIAGILYVKNAIEKSGDLSTHVQKKAIESVIGKENLTPTQQELLESGDTQALVEDLKENVTAEQIDCAVQAVGAERAEELLVTQDPTPQEMLKLSKCL